MVQMPADVFCQCIIDELRKLSSPPSPATTITAVNLIHGDHTITDEVMSWEQLINTGTIQRQSSTDSNSGSASQSPRKSGKKVEFEVLAMSSTNVEQVVADINAYVEKNVTQVEITDEAITPDTLTKNMVRALERKHHMSITTNYATSTVLCEGFVDDVLKLKLEFAKLLTKVKLAQTQFCKEVQWTYRGGGGAEEWLVFPMLLSYDIEDAYQTKKSRIILKDVDCPVYSVNLKTLTARMKDVNKECEVRRVQPPAN